MRAAAVALLCAAAACKPSPPPRLDATRELITAPDSHDRKIELYWRKPDGAGPFPVLVLLHGHQEPGKTRIGGRAFVEWGVVRQFADAGIVAVAMSQPGYGGSDGPADYCGPATQAAVRATVSHFRALPFVDGKRVALEGISRGAVVAAMVASQDDTLAGAVLISGVYRSRGALPRRPDVRRQQAQPHERSDAALGGGLRRSIRRSCTRNRSRCRC